MNKSENKLARDIVAMLIWRKRSAQTMFTRHGKIGGILHARFVEAHHAAEIARRMLYNS